MSTQKETIDHLLGQLGHDQRFTVRAMFGEYALYADKKVVALVCDDLLYVKITPQSNVLEEICEKDAPYDGAKDHYLVEEERWSMEGLPEILFAMAEVLPLPKKKKK